MISNYVRCCLFPKNKLLRTYKILIHRFPYNSIFITVTLVFSNNQDFNIFVFVKIPDIVMLTDAFLIVEFLQFLLIFLLEKEFLRLDTLISWLQAENV